MNSTALSTLADNAYTPHLTQFNDFNQTMHMAMVIKYGITVLNKKFK